MNIVARLSKTLGTPAVGSSLLKDIFLISIKGSVNLGKSWEVQYLQQV